MAKILLLQGILLLATMLETKDNYRGMPLFLGEEMDAAIQELASELSQSSKYELWIEL